MVDESEGGVFRRELHPIVQSIQFQSSEVFVWNGMPHRTQLVSSTPAQGPSVPPVVENVRRFLYRRYYQRRNLSSQDLLESHDAAFIVTETIARYPYVEHLSAAVQPFQEHLGGPVSLFPFQLFSHLKNNATDAPFDPASIGKEKIMTDTFGGWFWVKHSAWKPPYDRIVRIYWNVCLAGGIPLLRRLLPRLLSEKVPFLFKILDDPSMYDRADAAVLYFPSNHWTAARKVLVATHAELRLYLRKSVPLFTRRLAHGLGLAEDPDPGNWQSFGEHRMQLIAVGLWKAFEQRLTDPDDILARIRDQFEEAGIHPERPHLRKLDHSDYSWETLTVENPSLEV